MAKTLESFGINLNLGIKDDSGNQRGMISSSLMEKFLGEYFTESTPEHAYFKGVKDALETFILALACEGVDMESNKTIKAIETTIDAIANNK